jgi:hypothetical protein
VFVVVSMLRFFVMLTVHSRLVGSFAPLFAALALFIVPAVRGSLYVISGIFGVYVDLSSGVSRGDFWGNLLDFAKSRWLFFPPQPQWWVLVFKTQPFTHTEPPPPPTSHQSNSHNQLHTINYTQPTTHN